MRAIKPPLCKGRGCPVGTFVEDKSADRAGRRDRWLSECEAKGVVKNRLPHRKQYYTFTAERKNAFPMKPLHVSGRP